MNWTTVIFTSSAVICLTLTAFYFSVWIRQRDTWEYLLFSFAGIAAVMLSILEMNLLLAPTPSAYGEILRWMHVSSGVLMIAMVWFLRIYLNAGRDWLAWMVTGLRFLILLPNFLFYPNATFSEISEIRHVVFLGETFSIPTGAMNPWRILIDVSTLLFLLFVLDATVTAWKRGGRSRALTLGGTIVLVVVLSRISAELMSRGILPGTFISLCFLLIVVVMAHELSLDLLRARKLAIDLKESQQRMELAGRAASLEMWEWDVLKDEIWATRSTDRLAGIDAADRIKFDQYLETVHPDDQEALREVISQALDKDEQGPADGVPDNEPGWSNSMAIGMRKSGIWTQWKATAHSRGIAGRHRE